MLMQKKDMIANQDTVKKEKFYYDFKFKINFKIILDLFYYGIILFVSMLLDP